MDSSRNPAGKNFRYIPGEDDVVTLCRDSKRQATGDHCPVHGGSECLDAYVRVDFIRKVEQHAMQEALAVMRRSV